MQPAATLNRPRSATMDRRWSELESWTLEACVLRAEGRENEAAEVLNQRMPALIREWSLHCGLDRPVIVEQLRRLFADTQAFVARNVAQRRAAVSRAMAPVRSAAEIATAPLGLRRHVAINDIVGMLDGLAEAEREARRATVFPMRMSAAPAAALC